MQSMNVYIYECHVPMLSLFKSLSCLTTDVLNLDMMNIMHKKGVLLRSKVCS